jgi:hypothetical protein
MPRSTPTYRTPRPPNSNSPNAPRSLSLSSPNLLGHLSVVKGEQCLPVRVASMAIVGVLVFVTGSSIRDEAAGDIRLSESQHEGSGASGRRGT